MTNGRKHAKNLGKEEGLINMRHDLKVAQIIPNPILYILPDTCSSPWDTLAHAAWTTLHTTHKSEIHAKRAPNKSSKSQIQVTSCRSPVAAASGAASTSTWHRSNCNCVPETTGPSLLFPNFLGRRNPPWCNGSGDLSKLKTESLANLWPSSVHLG